MGYVQTRQKGDHVRLTSQEKGEHHVSVPLHKPLKVGTLGAILAAVGEHLGLGRDELMKKMEL